MKVEEFINCLEADFYTGVPDSLLKPFCDFLYDKYGVGRQHVIAANEGCCTGIAAGYYLATGRVAVVYLQNSGIGNIINPAASLLNDNVYAIPCIFVIGYRGEPGIRDEPQHVFQGKATQKLLEDMDISFFILSPQTQVKELKLQMKEFRKILAKGKSVAIVVRKKALTFEKNIAYANNNRLMREEALRLLVSMCGDDVIVSTTGKTSRELFEIREESRQSHRNDFLTVGSMGHTSSIALGLSLYCQEKRIWCIDGDGALLMHMGSLAVISKYRPDNLAHVVINNGSHESVGGLPTAASERNLSDIAGSCGYERVFCVCDKSHLKEAVDEIKAKNELTFLEIKCGIGSRDNLSRPTIPAIENKESFMNFLSKYRDGGIK